MTTQRRMTQQSARQLRAASDVAITYLANSEGYTIDMDGALVCASDGPMYYPTPTAAMRAIRRLRPDLSDLDVPVTWQTEPGPRPRLIGRDDSPEVLEQLQLAQEAAQKLFDGLTDDPATCDTRHAFYARSVLGRLMTLEMMMIQSELLRD